MPAAPVLLDSYCCEGGASRGYDRAGFAVEGSDLFRYRNAAGRVVGHSRRRYPYPAHQGDAVAFIREHGHRFDAHHASPPCWKFSAGTRAIDRSGYPDLIAATRDALEATGRPYIIENVEGARPWLRNPILLCGTMFGLTAVDDDGTPLEMWRHRLFESNVPIAAPGPCRHGEHAAQVAGAYGGARRDKHEARNVRHGGYVPAKAVQQRLLGIDWMTEKGLHQALPPAYTEHLGRQLLAAIG